MLLLLEQQVKKHITMLFEQADTSKLFYHNYQHTVGVVQRIETLSIQLSATETSLLKIAGWFHDVGYLYGHQHHEDRGMIIAQNYLKSSIAAPQVETILACIEATKLNLTPRNRLEKIIKDADIGYGTTEAFFETGPLLRKEWEAILGKVYTNKDWEKLQLNFLQEVIFYSPVAKLKYAPILKQNIEQQKKRLY